MNAADIIGYGFEGAEYHADCIDAKLRREMNADCKANGCTSRDGNGLCDQNCNGYGPNPIFGDAECDGTCDVCLQPMFESDDDESDDDDAEEVKDNA